MISCLSVVLNKIKKIFAFETVIVTILFLIYSILTVEISSEIRSDYIADATGILTNRIGKEITNFSNVLITFMNKHLVYVSTYNILIGLFSLFTFWAAYMVIRETFYTKTEKYICILGAMVMVISPVRIRYSMEWPNHSNWGFLLITILMLIKLITRQKESNIRTSVLMGIFLGIALIENIYQGLMLSIIFFPVLTYIGITLIKNRMTSKAIKIFISFIIPFLIFAFYVFVQTTKPIETYRLDSKTGAIASLERSPSDRWAFSARPWHYFIPDISHPVLGNFAVKIHHWIWDNPPYYLTEPFFPKEHSLYLGYSLLLLSIFTVYLLLRKKLCSRDFFIVKVFLIIGITAFIFSMPPYVAIKGIRIYFPSHFLYPVLPQLRAYARFGVFVFIANTLLAIIGLRYLTGFISKRYGKNKGYIMLITISTLMMFEFINFPPFHTISIKPTPPYQWLKEQPGSFSYMEIPQRADYSDWLYAYTSNHKKNIINPYLVTINDVKEIENSLWNVDQTFAKPDSLWCQNFRNLGGKYLFYHRKDINKNTIVKEFIGTGIVTDQLKVALAESWGMPVWGNHVPKTEKDLKKDKRALDMEMLLRNDPKFTVVKEFTNEEIVKSRSNSNFSADKFDAVTIFEINDKYCNKIAR